MDRRSFVRLSAVAALASVAFTTRAQAASAAQCSALSSIALPLTTITRTAWNAASATLPEHCRVEGVIGPGKVGFAVQLPSDWNGKLYHGGGGGFVGSVPDASAGLVLHYATAATDTGHTGNGPLGGVLDASWALNNPQAVIDFGYRAVHVTTTTAKAIAAAYYGRAARRAYFVGCSRGGGQGLMEAQRFPGDFDGIVVGAPAFHWTDFMMGFNWDSRAVAAAPIPLAKLPLVEQAVLKQCDASDGLVDGLVQDPRACSFEPAVLRCQGADAPTCLTGAQIEAFREVYAGPANSSGKRLTFGFPPGAESNGGWDVWISGGAIVPSLQFSFQDGFFRYIVFNNPAYDPFTFNFDTDPAKLAATGLILNAIDPDLRPFKKGGSKIVMYHGWSDHALSALKTIDYYQQVGDAMGDAQDFFRFFLVPGMHHCGGGPGPNTFDAFGALVAWVEEGKAPERIVASGGAVPNRTRPLCPYPKQAVYKGTGSIDDAANFVGRAPQPHDD
jgi:feruloyl esterase